jgi:hypothetical protein
MPRRPVRRGSTGGSRAGPIRPGSPLYRLLQLIAQEIVRDQEDRATRGRGTTPNEK